MPVQLWKTQSVRTWNVPVFGAWPVTLSVTRSAKAVIS